MSWKKSLEVIALRLKERRFGDAKINIYHE